MNNVINNGNRLLSCLFVFFFLFWTGGCTSDAEKKAQHYQKGMEYVTANNEKAAIIEFRNAVQIDPKYAAARYQLGLAYLKTSQTGEAFKELERAASLDPTNTDAQIKTAELYFLGKKLKESRAKVAAILEANKDFPDAYALLAQIELAEGNGTKAEKAIVQAVQLKPEVGRYYIIQGRVLASLNQVNEAEAALKKAVELDPAPNNFKALVAFYVSQKKEKEAEQILQDLLAKNPDSPQSYIDLAMFYTKKGDMEAVEKNILAAIGKSPDSAELYLMLGNFYYKTRNLEKAEKAYQDAVGKSAKPDDNKAVLANFYYETGKYDLAAKEIETILQSNAQHPMASFVQAKLMIRDQKNTEALVILDRLVRDVPRWGEAFYQKGVAHLNKGEAELSFNAVDQALKLAPYDTDARTLMAHHLFLKRDFEGARREAITVLQVAPNNFRAVIIFGKSLVMLGKTEDAVRLFTEMEKQAPDNIEILYNKAAACLAQKDFKQATVAFEKILTLKPDFTPALVALSGILIEDKKADQAITLVRKHLQESPKNLDYHLLLAGILERYGSAPDEALKLLRQAQELAPDSSRVYSMTSALLVRMGKKDEAIREYRMLVEKNPSDVKGFMALGTLLDQSGDVTGAKAAYEKALEIQPKFAAAANNLAWLIANSPEPDLGEALRLSLMAKEAFPEDPYIADTLGWIHYKRGSYKLALTQFAMATEKVPEMAILRYHLALALAADGQKEQAKMELTKVLAGKDTFPEYADAEKLLQEISK